MKTVNNSDFDSKRQVENSQKTLFISESLINPIAITQTIVDDFERQARRHKDKPALIFKDQILSYAALNQSANRLAHYLRKAGLAEGMMACICLEQSVEKIVCMLAILKAGVAYIPLDPRYPASRINFIMEDARAPFIVTTTDHSEKITNNAKVIFIDDPKANAQICACPDENPNLMLKADDLAYVIYTSGSTGNPKGVLIQHSSLKVFIDNHRPALGISENSRTLQFSSTSFDAAVIDLWIPLTSGATLVVYPDNRIIGSHLLEFIRNHQIDTLPLLSPTVLSSLPTESEIGELQIIGIGGEACPAPVLEYWRKKVQLVNAYGPTETTVAVTNFVCRPGYPAQTIGKPMTDVAVYILDENGNDVTDGLPGELYIGGPQLARGYLNNPELTNQKFVSHITEGQSVRVYKTGDLVKRLPDGNLEFVGRKDNQIKLRGYRIELDEIEIALNCLDGIKQAVVVPRDGRQGLVLLTAFVVAVKKPSVSEHTALKNTWRQQLADRLPAYMVPDHFEILAQMPMTVHGKIDKDSLQIPKDDHERSETPQEKITEDDYEQIIRAIWSKLLQNNEIGSDDDFFALGGHSLLLIHVYSALPQLIRKHIQIPDLYNFPTIRTLAEEVKKRQAAQRLSAEETEREVIKQLLDDATLRFPIQLTVKPDPGILADPSCVFLTGATGFVGAHLLYELLHQTHADIFCLVRADDSSQGMQRLMNTFEKFRLPWQSALQSRILPVTGDLSSPQFGLSEADYELISTRAEIIYHSGSSVSYLQPYDVIKSSNIDGLHHILQLTTTGRPKFLALLSSMGVFSWGRPFTGKTWMYENDNIDQNLRAVSKDLGYIKSKWVMEKIIHEASGKGIQMINFRLGFAVCSQMTGATVLNQWWGSLVRSCVELGAFPLVMGLKDELTTVDYMAKAIVHISQKKEAVGRHFHLSPDPENDVSLTDFFAKMNEYYDLGLKGLPYNEWLDLWKQNTANPLYPLLSLFTDDVHEGKSLVEAYENTYYYDRSNTKKFLGDTTLRPPVFNKELMTPYLHYMGILQ